jgi:hypothetical protein
MTDSTGRTRGLTAAIALLVLGAAIGISADRLLHRGLADHVTQAERFHDDPFAVLDSALSFRPEQREAVHAILRARQEDVDQVWSDTHTRLLAIIDSAMAQLEAMLDSSQVEHLHRLAAVLHDQPSNDPSH